MADDFSQWEMEAREVQKDQICRVFDLLPPEDPDAPIDVTRDRWGDVLRYMQENP